MADVGRTCSDGICCSLVTSASAKPTERKSSFVLFEMLSSGMTAIDRIGGGADDGGAASAGFGWRLKETITPAPMTNARIVTTRRIQRGRARVRPSDECDRLAEVGKRIVGVSS